MQNNISIVWKLRSFHEISAHELYDCLQLRQLVFIKEQNCVYVDNDGVDKFCFHLMGFYQQHLYAYARLIPPGVLYNEPSIGRVVTHPEIRRTGLGKLLFKKAMLECDLAFGKQPVKIMAQSYLVSFYENYGFSIRGDEFMEDGIPHFYMIS